MHICGEVNMLVLCPFLFHKNYDSLTNFYATLRSLKVQMALVKDRLDRKLCSGYIISAKGI